MDTNGYTPRFTDIGEAQKIDGEGSGRKYNNEPQSSLFMTFEELQKYWAKINKRSKNKNTEEE